MPDPLAGPRALRKRAEALNHANAKNCSTARQAMTDLLTRFALASDAVQLAVLGAGFWLVAAACGVMEWRRGRGRSLERLERVGWVPWMPIFLACAFTGGGCLAVSLPVFLGSV